MLLLLNGFFVARLVGLSYGHFSWEAYAQTYGPGESGGGLDSCTDNVDNDMDMLTDCADPDCFGQLPCAASAPVVSFTGLVGLGVVLGSVGVLVLRRRSR
jgi:hypothetical protein